MRPYLVPFVPDGRTVASLDDLEAMKRAAGRPIDLIDLEEIEVIRRLSRAARPGAGD